LASPRLSHTCRMSPRPHGQARRRRHPGVREGSQTTFWEFPFQIEVDAPDSAIQELEELATLVAGANWGMELRGPAMHFRFQHEKSLRRFVRACWTRKYRTLMVGMIGWLERARRS